MGRRGGTDVTEAPPPAHPSHFGRTLLTYVIDGAVAAAQEKEGAGCVITCDRRDLLDLRQQRDSAGLARFPHKVSLRSPCLASLPLSHNAHFCVPSLARLPAPKPIPSTLPVATCAPGSVTGLCTSLFILDPLFLGPLLLLSPLSLKIIF